ncbi:MAG: M14 family zinc carboxypeptidase [Leptothrix sp. (in: b-proteobacteria)]
MTSRWQQQSHHLSAGAAVTAGLPELAELQTLIDAGASHLHLRTLCEVGAGPHRFPVELVTLGCERADAPAVAFVGGVHGLECIGSEVVLAYLRSLVMRLAWDESLHRLLDAVRLVFLPVVNPGGLWLGTRANPNGVDLMRSAPVEADDLVPPLAGGHRLSRMLPWYRGALGGAPQPECAALCEAIETELLGRPFSMAIDCHSGFGLRDRLWFPFARSRTPMTHLAEVHAFGGILDASLLHHRYVLEPQSRQYLAHGDIWDHLYLQAGAHPGTVFLPLTLEMGSWLWVKKNPWQMFNRLGIFNPQLPHRQQRVLRRHLAGLDFVTRAAASWQRWLPQGDERCRHHEQALARWYGPDRPQVRA